MKIQEFIEKIEVEFVDLTKGTLNSESSFRDIEDWSSMHALIIIALIDSEYDVLLNGEDLKSAVTIQDLYDIVLKKMQ
jgi:acyl carrier protein